MDKDTPGFWTAANIFTLLRILLVPPFVLALVGRRSGLALALFTVAGLTDFLDGMAARLLNQKTQLGVTFDPAADKLLMTASFITLSLRSVGGPNLIPVWLTGLVIGRDAAIALGALVIVKAVGSKAFLPTLWGKASTVLQLGCVFLVLLFNVLGSTPRLLAWVYVVTFAATFISGAHYFACRFWPWIARKKGR
ncbi:MAG: CDP-alcohol phosphatidyltransferase family protein [Candidatus Aminicenantes bacterium]|nr:CDP-alcohol phosphatidyltransferase family protein [Candidatus Aminicenantes bacterium]